MRRDLEAREILRIVGQASWDAGMRTYLVGGAVRDRLLGLPTPSDLDFVVEEGSAADLAQRITARLGSPAPVLFPRFHTAQIQAPPWKLEFVDSRSESYRETSRKPDVARASLREDLLRRDFTINTFLQDLQTGQVLDLLGARKDLRKKILRTPREPLETVRDDPLRMLRAVRFSIRFGFSLLPELEDAVRREASSLWAKVSAERVKAELDLIILLSNPEQGFLLLDRLGLLALILPELEAAKEIPQDKLEAPDLFQHTLLTLKRSASFLPDPPNPRERYAALFHDLGKVRTLCEEGGILRFTGHEEAGAEMASSILERLRASREEIEEVSFLIRWHMLPTQYQSTWSDAAVKRLVRRLGSFLKGVLRLTRADIYGLEDREHAFWQLVGRIEALGAEAVQRMESPLNGEEIMRLLGEGPGLRIGRIKEELLEAVLEGSIENDPEEARSYLKRKYGLVERL